MADGRNEQAQAQAGDRQLNDLERAVLDALRPVQDPELHKSLVDLGMIRDLRAADGVVSLRLELTTPACPLADSIERDVRQAATKVAGVREVRIERGARVRQNPAGGRVPFVPGVKNVVLVGSGKGGVGKSTAAVGIALGLARSGARVGLLDADIYGPSIPIMLGARDARPAMAGGKLQPVDAHGLKLMSIGFFVSPEDAMVWRGPMASGAIIQFFRDVEWGELDYLVLDLPPGTGDIQLTIAQQVRVSGAVIVTTPQDLALADAIKAKTMFDKVDIPVLGIVENMSYFVCGHCGGRTDIFHHGGGALAAEKLGVTFLGEVPLVPSIREAGDAGVPVLVSAPQSPEAQALEAVARKVAGQVSVANEAAARPTVQAPAPTPKGLVQIRLNG